MRSSSSRVLLIAVVVILAVATFSTLAACSSSPSTSTTQPPSTSKSTTQAPSSAAPTQASGPSITLKWTTIEPDAPSSSHDLLIKLGNAIDQQTQGRVKIRPYWGNVLGAPQDTLKMLQSGVADGATVIPTYLQWEIPLYAGAGLPFFTTGYQTGAKATWALYQQWPAMQDEWNKVGVKPIWAFQPWEHWFGLNQSINTLDDLKGKKIWAGGFWPDLVQQFGIVPVPMNAVDAYDALQKGVIIGVINPYHTFRTTRYFEVTKYMVKWPFGGQPVNAWAISLSTWNKISPADQKTITDLAAGLDAQYFSAMQAEGDSLTKFFKDNGVNFITLSDAEYARIAKIGKPAVWDKWLATAKDKGVPGQEFLNKYQAAVNQASGQK